MPSVEQEFIVIAIHGEGDRKTVNSLAQYRNDLEVARFKRAGREASAEFKEVPDEPPDVMIVLRDEHHNFRIEWPVTTWDEVDIWKELAGWDADKRHWQHGAKVKVSLGG